MAVFSTGVRFLLRRHVLQYDRADKSDQRSDNDHAQKSHEPRQRSENKISVRRPVYPSNSHITRVIVSVVVNPFAILDRYVRVSTHKLLLY